MKHFARILAAAAILFSLAPHSASAAFLAHRFVVWNDTTHCFTMTVQQRDQKKPATFDRVRPGARFDQILHYDRDIHDWFLEWTIWNCSASGELIAPIYTGFAIDRNPNSISDYVVTPLGSAFQMTRKN
ncbi:MAG TPA: hypothetical protein VNF68_11965 [Candidatus Baltobacteraceae bacterium]|nr:hypothetical protein [Candidatus Baltobacteraceae bacterium]